MESPIGVFSFYVIFVLCLFSVREYLNIKYKDTRHKDMYFMFVVCAQVRFEGEREEKGIATFKSRF